MPHVHQNAKPLLVDNSLNRAFAIKYGIYAVFGFSGMVSHVPSIALVAGQLVATIVGGIIGVAGVWAAASAWNFMKSPRWQRSEVYATVTLVAFVSVYVATLLYLAAIGEGSRLNLAIIATALLVMPIWRIRYIIKKSHHE